MRDEVAAAAHGVICSIPESKKRTSVHARVRLSAASSPDRFTCS